MNKTALSTDVPESLEPTRYSIYKDEVRVFVPYNSISPLAWGEDGLMIKMNFVDLLDMLLPIECATEGKCCAAKYVENKRQESTIAEVKQLLKMEDKQPAADNSDWEWDENDMIRQALI